MVFSLSQQFDVGEGANPNLSAFCEAAGTSAAKNRDFQRNDAFRQTANCELKPVRF
jgi:hypothetical protein